MIIDAKTGLAGTSDVAVDDFQLIDGFCVLGVEGITI